MGWTQSEGCQLLPKIRAEYETSIFEYWPGAHHSTCFATWGLSEIVVVSQKPHHSLTSPLTKAQFKRYYLSGIEVLDKESTSIPDIALEP